VAVSAPPVAAPSSAAVRPGPARRAPRVPHSLAIAVVATIVAIIAVQMYVAHATHGEPVAVAARDIASGETVSPSDFHLVEARVPPSVGALGTAEVQHLHDEVALHSLTAGQIVGHTDVAPAAGPSRQRAMSIPVPPERAVAGQLRRGDVVDVIDTSGGDAAYVVVSAQVLAAGADAGKALGNASSGQYAVTLAVDDRAALRLATAAAAGKLFLVRSTGAPATALTPPTTAPLKR
jgi:Flp pilus assembly protein CpaB